MIIKAIYESIVQAVQELNSNKLRSFLSSLGITIGIFCIISVLSAVDSLERNITESFEKLGNDVLYVAKQPWQDSHGGSWWKYMRNPAPDHDDFEVIDEHVKGAEFTSLSIIVPGRTVEFGSSNVRGGFMAGLTYNYADITKLEFINGRYFTPYEYKTGANKVILGYQVADELFRDSDPEGRTVKIGGQKYQVIAVLKKEGSSLINIFNMDQAILISYNTLKKIVSVKTGTTWGTTLSVKAKPGVKLVDLKDEVTGVLRAHRKLKPKEENNFAINELSMVTDALKSFFSVMNIVGIVIGIFAMIVGAFSVANIMFVSVKERTNIIGIKKALGAKRGVILLEFLIEAILLCMVGGLIGLAAVVIVLKLISGAIDFDLFVSMPNILKGLIGAIGIGVIAGIIPAFQAARMDPVEAIRK